MNKNFTLSIAKKDNEIIITSYTANNDPVDFYWLTVPLIFWAIVLIFDSRLFKKIDRKKH